jgi:hypothetical protein
MSDYLIEQYNIELAAIQRVEQADLDAAIAALDVAVAVYHEASRTAVQRAAQRRFEASERNKAALAQRDHEYHNGRSAPIEEPPPQPPVDPPPTAVALDERALIDGGQTDRFDPDADRS